MINIAIVEDEKLYVSQFKEYISRYEKESGNRINVSVFPDGAEIVENYSGDFDIILMDIQMKYMDGMTAAEQIRKLDSEVIIMFITNMTQYAIRGYEVDALDYVVKPVEYFSFSQKYRIFFPKQPAGILPGDDSIIGGCQSCLSRQYGVTEKVKECRVDGHYVHCIMTVLVLYIVFLLCLQAALFYDFIFRDVG